MQGKKIALVTHCLINTNAPVPEAAVARYPAMVDEVVEFLKKRGIGVVQMPCPEFEYFGPSRPPAGKHDLEVREYRGFCGRLADGVAKQVSGYRAAGRRVLFVLGQGASPSCGAGETHVTRDRVGKGDGIFIEELRKRLGVPFVNINVKDIEASIRRMEELL